MKIGACYIRVSTADQTEHSPDSQLRMIREYALKNDIALSEEYIYRDEGISGRTVEKRPAFQKMISAAKQKCFDVILVYSTSRFARNHEQSIVYRSMLEREYGVSVVSITQPNIDKKTDMLTSAIYSIMDEWYSMDLADNVKRGMTEKALKGGHQTVTPFGYERKYKGAELTVKEDEAETVKQIFAWYLSGKSTWKIARELNSMGVKTKKNSQINTKNLEYMLTNPTYKGYTRWNANCKKDPLADNSAAIIAKGQHEPIIDELTFDEVQKKIHLQATTRTKNARPKETTKHWLSGILKCSACGRTLNYACCSYSENVRPRFRCGGYTRGECETSNYITAHKAETYIMQYFEQISKNIDILYELPIEVTDKNAEKLAHLNTELEKLTTKMKKAKQGFLSDLFTLDEFRTIKHDCDSKVNNINKQIAELEQNKINYVRMQNDIANIYTILTNAGSNDDDKQTAIRSIVRHITYNRKLSEFRFYFYS